MVINNSVVIELEPLTVLLITHNIEHTYQHEIQKYQNNPNKAIDVTKVKTYYL